MIREQLTIMSIVFHAILPKAKPTSLFLSINFKKKIDEPQNYSFQNFHMFIAIESTFSKQTI